MTYEPCGRTPCLRSARTLARLVVFACALCVAAGALCAAPFADGLASTKAWAADPVPITTADELRAVKAGDSTVSYVLMADIDLGGAEWTPIGKPSGFNDDSGSGFRGMFDGNGHTIKNFTVSSFSTNAGIWYAGFFGATNGATIKDLTLQNASVAGTSWAGADLMAGTLVGLAVNTNISGCNAIDVSVQDMFSGTRTDANNYAVGGLVGDYYSGPSKGSPAATVAVSDCSVVNALVVAGADFGDFKVSSGTPVQAFTGGIVGRIRERAAATASVVDSLFDGNVSGAGFVGPVVGGARSSANETSAAAMSSLAAARASGCWHAGTSEGLGGAAVNGTYNCGAGVWNADGSYAAAPRLTAGNRDQALAALGSAWRVATLPRGTTLVLDHRGATIQALSPDGGQAVFAAALYGFYGADDEQAADLSWLVDGQSAGSGTGFQTPITDQEQVVELQLLDGGAVICTDVATVAAAQLDFSMTKERNAQGEVVKLTVILRSASAGFTVEDFSYAWYGVKDGTEVRLSASGATLEKDQFAGYESFKVVAQSSAFSGLSAELATNVSGRTVYLSMGAGDDNNSGFEPAKPVATFQKAYTLLKEDVKREDNVIVVMDAYADTEYGYDESTFSKPATITSYDADADHDYRAANGAYLSLYNTSTSAHPGADSTVVKGKLLFADTAFKDITLSAADTTGGWAIGYVYCQGHSLTMDTGVRMEGYRQTSAAINSYGLLAGTNTQDFNIVGGYANYDEPVGTGYDQSRGTCEIVVRSGSYGRIIAGGRNFGSAANGNSSVNRDSHNQFGTEDEPFNVAVTVDIAESQSQIAADGKLTCDIGQLCGGQTDGTIYCNAVINLKDGVVPLVLGSSIGYPRSVNGGGTAYPNNDFVGSVQVNMAGGSVAQLYGGCLGRYTGNADLSVDSRFRSSSKTPEGRPDIEINVSGGTIGPLESLGKNNAKNMLTGLFAAGAGGVTGAGDPEAGTVSNAVDVQVNISGGTIEGRLYGGGYGQSSGVPAGSALRACLEAGNLYGSSTVNITGGTIDADVYGGGAGTAAYLSGNPDANALAQIVGDVRLSIENATINGNVYGGSQGVVAKGHDCTSMAKITGDVRLSIQDAAISGTVFGGSALGVVTGDVASSLTSTTQGHTVQGSVYGGGEGSVLEGLQGDDWKKQQRAVGQIGGDASLSVTGYAVGGDVFGGGKVGAVLGKASTVVEGASVAGAVYGGGEGSYLGEDNDDLALQTIVGWVAGDVSLELGSGAHVDGNVFGGGNLGVVGDGAPSSGVVPYTVNGPAAVSVRVRTATIGGSVFGGGAGSAAAAGQMPRLLGAVFGTSAVTVHEGTIGSDVFGGGDQSYTYAPLDASGQSLQATSVVVNAGDGIYVHEDDGRVAEGAGDGIREVDVPAGASGEERIISVGGSVFGGGNIADAHTVSANNYTVYGATEVFVKGVGVGFTNDSRGGVYGDGNLSRAYGERFVTLIDLATRLDDGTLASKSFLSLQRANRAIVHHCSVYLKGAKDLVNESDTTLYSLNRIDDLNVYANSTVQFDTVVNGLGNLYSDVLPNRTFTSAWDGLVVGGFGDNVTDQEKASYRVFCEGNAAQGTWTDAEGTAHDTANTIIVNNGKWLDVKESNDTSNAAYGTVTGLFTLVSDTAAEGGAFVFGQYRPADSTGTFISLNKSSEAAYLDLYTKPTKDADGTECRVWFIKGQTYRYERDLKAFTTSSTASIQVLLPVEQADEGTQLRVGDAGIAITGGLDNLQKSADKGAEDKFAVHMTLGSGMLASDALPFYEGASTWPGYDFGSYVAGESPALMPATITINLDELGADEELKTQSGTIEFDLVSTDEKTYHFKITVVLDRAYASAYEKVHYGRVYENIAVENATPITPTSAYTAQFTTTYSPGAYRSDIQTYLKSGTTAATQGENHDSVFPQGTKITMVDITNPARPAYYYHECKSPETSIPLTEFTSMATGQSYANPRGNTVIVEDLLFVVDYAQANPWNGGYDGQRAGATYLALDHLYGSAGKQNDILCYTRTNDQGETEERKNNLWNAFTVSSTTDDDYLEARLLNPDNAASANRVKVGHTDNFMYDTYTTRLELDVDSSCVSTLYDENEVMLQLWLEGKSDRGGADYRNRSFPIGTKVVVKRSDGTVADERYFNEQGTDGTAAGFVLVNLGNRLDRTYTVELQVARYVAGGSLDSVFDWGKAKASDEYRLNVDLYVSADGLYRSTDDPVAQANATFESARSHTDSLPLYELDDKYENPLEFENGQVTGEIVLKKGHKNNNSDAQMTVLRKQQGGTEAAVNIEDEGGSVTRELRAGDNQVRFTIVDPNPPQGTLLYEIRLGNTVYYQTITVS